MVDWDTLIEELNSIGTEVYANLSTPGNLNLLYARLVWDDVTETKETVDNIVNSAFEGQFYLISTLENNQYKAAMSEYSGPAF
jgi:hypothetical protein